MVCVCLVSTRSSFHAARARRHPLLHDPVAHAQVLQQGHELVKVEMAAAVRVVLVEYLVDLGVRQGRPVLLEAPMFVWCLCGVL